MNRAFIAVGLLFFYKKIIVVGKENIPKKGAVLLVSNHKNALLDPLLIATHTSRSLHFLTRASAFKIPFVKWLLSTVNMLPIYRMRDGKASLAKNEAIFNYCFNLLHKGQTLLIFPEGTHDIRRLVRPLSKGFTRITFGVLEKHPDLPLSIIPVGLNYSDARLFGESVSIRFGEPINVNNYYHPEDLNNAALTLKEVVSDAMKKLTVHIPMDTYDEKLASLGDVNFLNPDEINAKLQSNQPIIPVQKSKTNRIYPILKGLVTINSILPMAIYKMIEPNIKEPEFISTTKVAVGLTAFPLFYTLQALVVGFFFGNTVGWSYGIFSVLLVWLTAKSK
ncbi:lysophospholipid acyltransferase family protein [Flavobacteriaceae bacterium F08102]|nr:lysophospholipid acyltransferase family protein [Flavobacteriaceae bacterium F08102]